MQQNKQIKNLTPVFTLIILCCSCLILLHCEGKTNFERNIDFGNGWQKKCNSNSAENSTIFRKEFELDFQEDKLYILQLPSPENVLKLQVNNATVYGNTDKSNTINYNITDQLEKQNIIELTKINTTDFKAKIHCINKLFITDIDLELNSFGSALVEVKVKNVFETEKQGVLVYNIYAVKNQKLEGKATPVFISGKAENTYRRELNFDNKILDEHDLRIECQLYCNDILFDSNYKILALRKELPHSKID